LLVSHPALLTSPDYLCDNDAVTMPKWMPFSRADFQDPGQRDAFFISLSQCATSFSLNFVAIFLPFYILNVSPYSQRETLLWLGAIIGVMGICTAITSPIWGSFTHSLSPKKLYQRGQIAHAALFLLMGFTVNLHVLFGLRVLQGIFGGVSTIGLIILSATSSREKVTPNIGLFQSAQTLGQLVGPPLGTLAAATFGYRGSFLCGSALLFGSFLLCQLKVSDIPKLPRPLKSDTKRPFDRQILAGWIVCFMAQIQLVFLPAILPNVLEKFQVQGPLALKVAGVIVMSYTIATMTGIFIWTRLVRKTGPSRMITFLLLMGITMQALLSFTQGVFSFTIIRMLQTGFVAATIPLVISIFVRQKRGGTVLGFMNGSRFSGNSVGPMLAASVLTVSSLQGLYFLISGLTAIALISFWIMFRSGEQT
jgi:MFS transporter, DHA1 family, multidrug resistance protein